MFPSFSSLVVEGSTLPPHPSCFPGANSRPSEIFCKALDPPPPTTAYCTAVPLPVSPRILRPPPPGSTAKGGVAWGRFQCLAMDPLSPGELMEHLLEAAPKAPFAKLKALVGFAEALMEVDRNMADQDSSRMFLDFGELEAGARFADWPAEQRHRTVEKMRRRH